MRVRLLALATLFMVAATVAANRADAVEPDYYSAKTQLTSMSDINRQFEDMQIELTSLRNQLENVSYGGCDAAGGCDSGCGGCDTCCRGRSWYAGYELTFLRPYISENVGPTGFSTDAGTGHRLVFGFDGDSGVGGRIRYWFYNHGHDFTGGTLGIDMDVFDVEVTLYEQLCNWDLLVSGGIRYGRAAITSAMGRGNFEGYGPTLALEALREVGSRGFYLVGNGRCSLLLGNVGVIGGGAFGATSAQDEITTVLENQLGVGWSRDLDNSVLDLRLLWETQFWLNNAAANTGSNLGLSGVTVAAQLRY